MEGFFENIKQRNDILVQERKKLRTVTVQLEESRQVEIEHQSLFDQSRQRYLEQMTARNEVELQLLKSRDKIQECEVCIDILEKERRDNDEQALMVEAEWKDQVQHIYGPQTMQMEWYLRCLENTIRTKQSQVQAREARLAAIKDQFKELKEEEDLLEQEGNHLQNQVVDLDRDGGPGGGRGVDEEISTLSKRVGETLEEVCFFC